MEPASPKNTALSELVAAIAAWLGISLVEAAALALDAAHPGPVAFWASFRVVGLWTLRLATPIWIFAAALCGVALALAPSPSRGAFSRRWHIAISIALASALAVWIHTVLGSYPAFRWYPPFLAASVGFALVLGIGHAGGSLSAPVPALLRRALCAAWPAIGLLGFAALHIANGRLFAGLYPTLHLAALLWAAGLLQLGLFSILVRRSRLLRPRRLALAGALAGALLAAPAALSPAAALEKALETAASTPGLGGARLVGLSYDPRAEDAMRGPIPAEPEAPALFARLSGLPRLPDGFRVEDHNVLLITSEATRFDQTSLHRPDLGTTPFLASLVADGGAISFDRAFSPSSGTLHSMASLLCMTFPSMTTLETWKKSWHGRLPDAEDTVPELFQRSGYDTFLLSHNHMHVFGKAMLGLDQGFATKRYFSGDGEDEADAERDRDIADAAIREISERAATGRRFFGWIFFASPHADYFAHYGDMPAETKLERYRQEIRFVDSQIGRVVEALRGAGLLEKTVLAFTGDHGEEFLDHGGTYHKTTVYSESTWVPLVVRVPGLAGGRVSAPTSATYLFPWLALAGPKPLEEAASSRLSNDIAPMMRATNGAVVVELIGHDRMLSSLVTATRKTNYDFISNRVEMFDAHDDVAEHADLARTSPALESEARAAIDAYRRVRAGRRRYILATDR